MPPRDVAVYVDGGVADEQWARDFDGMGRHRQGGSAPPPARRPAARRSRPGLRLWLGPAAAPLAGRGRENRDPRLRHRCRHRSPGCSGTSVRRATPPVCGPQPPLPHPDGFFDVVLARGGVLAARRRMGVLAAGAAAGAAARRHLRRLVHGAVERGADRRQTGRRGRDRHERPRLRTSMVGRRPDDPPQRVVAASALRPGLRRPRLRAARPREHGRP